MIGHRNLWLIVLVGALLSSSIVDPADAWVSVIRSVLLVVGLIAAAMTGWSIGRFGGAEKSPPSPSNDTDDEVRRLRNLLDGQPLGLFGTDSQDVIRYANATLGVWLGESPESLLSRHLSEFIIDTGDGGGLGLRGRNGEVFTAIIDPSRVVTDNSGMLNLAAVVRREMLPTMPLEVAAVSSSLETVDNRLHWLFDEAPVAIALLNLDGAVTDCNRTFLKMLGLHREVVIGRPLVERINREDRGDLTTGLSKIVMGTARAAHLEVRLPGYGQREMSVSFYASRMEDDPGEVSGLIVHLIDSTEQKNLEVQFAQSQKMEAVGQLAGGVAHDFNNLLTAMIGFCDLLLERHGPNDPSFADIQQIRQNANRATNLVRQLLAFSRKQTLEPVELDVREALADLSNLLSRLIGENVTLEIAHARDLLNVWVDRGQFDQVIINLTVNARDAMPGGGEIEIKTSAVKIDEAVHRGTDMMPIGRYVLIEVIDTGTGISRQHLDHIFEPFFSTKEVGAGTGLGLSTVHGIVHQTGGYIFVDSAPGEGTTFSIYLPERQPASPEAEAAADSARVERVAHTVGPAASAEAASDLTGRGLILLVEDEVAVRMFATRALRNKGYTVLEADNGETALDVINSVDAPIDLIISDMIMPGMDGHTLVNLIRHEMPGVKVILISGYADTIYHDEIERDPGINFLGKPFSLMELAKKVKQVLGS